MNLVVLKVEIAFVDVNHVVVVVYSKAGGEREIFLIRKDSKFEVLAFDQQLLGFYECGKNIEKWSKIKILD